MYGARKSTPSDPSGLVPLSKGDKEDSDGIPLFAGSQENRGPGLRILHGLSLRDKCQMWTSDTHEKKLCGDGGGAFVLATDFFGNFAGFETARANGHFHGAAVNHSVDLLQIGKPAPRSLIISVGHVISKRGLFAADITTF